MQLDHRELRPQIGFGLSWIERAARVEPFGRHAPELTALRLCHMSQLVGQEFVPYQAHSSWISRLVVLSLCLRGSSSAANAPLHIIQEGA
jgi:hypothetical protein